MELNKMFNSGPTCRAMLNIGCLLDIPTGHYRTGKDGESILNGGLSFLTGVVGRANYGKTTLAYHLMLTVLDRYTDSQAMFYDTECTGGLHRISHIARYFDNLDYVGIGYGDSEQVFYVDKTTERGSKWFQKLKDIMKIREDPKNKYILNTPFIDKNKEYIKAKIPFVVEVDSFSNFSIDTVDQMYEKGEIGDSDLNTDALHGARAKTQMMSQLPDKTAASGTYMILSAYVSDSPKLGRFPSPKKLLFLKGDVKIKWVTDNFNFLLNNLWWIFNSTSLEHDDKTAYYPYDERDLNKENFDLMEASIVNLRGKSGSSGSPIRFIYSQDKGILPTLSEFHYLRHHKLFGVEGAMNGMMNLHLLPELRFRRTTVRRFCQENKPLQRAMTITAELLQMRNFWDIEVLGPDMWCEPKVLYEDIKALGYDWDVLLATRGYWIFNEHSKLHPLPFLSTMDLLNMRKQKYRPKWYDNYAKKFKENKDGKS